MNDRDKDSFEPRIADWLEGDPNNAPDQALQVVLAAFPSIKQRHASRLPWRFLTMTSNTKFAFAALAVVAVVVGGLLFLRPATDQPGGVGGPGSAVPSASPAPSASQLPSASPAPSTSAIPEPPVGAMTQEFTSPTFGYAIRYPAGWTATPTTGEGPTSGGADDFVSAAGGWYLRALSRAIPDGVVVDDWIRQTLTASNAAECAPPRDTLESVTVDGHEGRILGFCGVPPAPQIEATVVVDKRAYLFTLFDSREPPTEAEARALFDTFMTTITLDPAG